MGYTTKIRRKKQPKGMETGVKPALAQTQGERPHASKRRNTKQIRGRIAAIRSGRTSGSRKGGTVPGGIFE